MKNKIIYIVIVLVAIAAAGVLFFAPSDHRNMQPGPAASESKNTTEQFAGFSLKDYSRKVITSDEFKGKPLVINTWASWCPFCKQELPDFVTVQKEFGDKVIIIAIDRGESSAVAKKYSDQLDVTNNLVFLLDPSDSFYRSIGGFSMPETIFMDKNGTIIDHKRGPMDINEIRQRITKLL